MIGEVENKIRQMPLDEKEVFQDVKGTRERKNESAR